MPCRDTLVVEGRSSTTRCRARRRCYFNTLSGASGLGVTDYRTAGDVKVTQVFRRLVDRRRRGASRPSGTTCRAAGSIDVRCAPTTATARGRSAFAGTNDRINPIERDRGRRRPTQHARLPGRRHAGARRRRDRPVEPHVLDAATATTPIRTSSLDTRPTTGDIARVAHALQPVLRRAGRDAAGSRYRYLHDSFGSDSNTFEAPWVQALPRGFTRDAGPALLHAERGGLLLRPAVPGTASSTARPYTRRHAALGVRRVHRRRRRSRRRSRTAGASICASTSTASSADWRARRRAAVPGLEPFSARWIAGRRRPRRSDDRAGAPRRWPRTVRVPRDGVDARAAAAAPHDRARAARGRCRDRRRAAHRGEVLALSRRQRRRARSTAPRAARPSRSTPRRRRCCATPTRCHRAERRPLRHHVGRAAPRVGFQARSRRACPTRDELAAPLALVGWARVEWDERAIRLPRARHGDRLRRHRQGVRGRSRRDDLRSSTGSRTASSISAGDVRAIGAQPDGAPWRVGIRHPRVDGRDDRRRRARRRRGRDQRRLRALLRARRPPLLPHPRSRAPACRSRTGSR